MAEKSVEYLRQRRVVTKPRAHEPPQLADTY